MGLRIPQPIRMDLSNQPTTRMGHKDAASDKDVSKDESNYKDGGWNAVYYREGRVEEHPSFL